MAVAPEVEAARRGPLRHPGPVEQAPRRPQHLHCRAGVRARQPCATTGCCEQSLRTNTRCARLSSTLRERPRTHAQGGGEHPPLCARVRVRVRVRVCVCVRACVRARVCARLHASECAHARARTAIKPVCVRRAGPCAAGGRATRPPPPKHPGLATAQQTPAPSPAPHPFLGGAVHVHSAPPPPELSRRAAAGTRRARGGRGVAAA